jgi:hypothetical protein
MPTPYRRCYYLDDRGEQCEKWFPATDDNKLCLDHREFMGVNGHANPANTAKYIDLVNDEREYCYHFLSGARQKQSKTLIFEFKDDEDGTVFEKIDSHIAFIEKVLEDMKARLHSARAVKSEKLDELSEEERKELRKQKVEKAINPERAKKAKSFKSDPIGNLTKSGLSADKAKALMEIDDIDAFLERFNKAKENKS